MSPAGAAGSRRFESVAEAERRARQRLPRSVFLSVFAGYERGVTIADNVAAFAELGFAPRVAELPRTRDLSTEVMGRRLALPVLVAPTGVQAVHPDGEVAVARATAAVGTAMALSNFASKPVEDVLTANPNTFVQLYWAGTRERIAYRVERARRAGAVGLIVTLDFCFPSGRDWGSPKLPARLDVRSALSFAPEVIRRPRWLAGWLRSGALPQLTAPNMAGRGEPPPAFVDAYAEWRNTPLASWDDVRWIRDQWDGPMMIKGIMRVDDACRAAEIGADAISVSNHGGNNLDGTPASIRVLPGIVDAVGGSVEVLFDSGIRRGSDVVKALALGARAVMVGRATLWGLAVNGQAGVENVFDILRTGIDATLVGIGCASVRDLGPDDVLVPDGFTRVLGGPRRG